MTGLWAPALLFVLAAGGGDLPVPTGHYARERTYDVLHYKLELAFDVPAKTCSGDVTILLVPLRPHLERILLDAAGLSIRSVMLGRKRLEFEAAGESLLVTLDRPCGPEDTVSLTVSYSVASPKKGLYFVVPDSGYPERRPHVWSQGEAEDNRYWFPCYDYPNDKATSEMVATVDGNFTAISNGALTEVRRDAGRRTATYHWSESKPHASYLISIVAGEYRELRDSAGSVPLSYYVPAQLESIAKNSFALTPKMVGFFSQRIGVPYPWEKYSQTVVQDFILEGQENVSATTLTELTMHDERAHLDYTSDGLVAHELAHQWWGDLVSFRDWSHSWLSEGFATYFEMLFREEEIGADAADKAIFDAQTSVVNADAGDRRRPTVCNRFVEPNDLFDNRIYAKGACVLHMLRFTLGDELFWKAIRLYAARHAFQVAETNDFKLAIEDATGYNMHWFFEEWLEKAGTPVLNVSSEWNQATRAVTVRVDQVQRTDSLTGLFTMPVEIEVWVHGTPETHRVTFARAHEEFSFPAYQKPQLVIFDKGNRLLKKAVFQKPVEEWTFQLQHAAHGIDRYAAVDELRWFADSGIVFSALSQAALQDPFWEVRRNAAFALGDARTHSAEDTLTSVYGDRDSRVRSAAVASLRNVRSPAVVRLLQHAFEKDPSYAVAAAALSALVQLDSLNAKQYCLDGLARDSFREGIRIAALRGLAEAGGDEALESVRGFTSYGRSRNLRVESIGLLARKWGNKDDVVDDLLRLLGDPGAQVRRAAAEALGVAGDEKALEPLQRAALTDNNSRVVRAARESMEKIRQAHK